MKKIFYKLRILSTSALALIMLGACSDVLNEQPRSIYDPSFFKTQSGIEGGLTALYAHLRDTYGKG